jgi:ABC-2 type transport system permease protein
MKVRRILAIAQKETIHVIRDWRSLLMAFSVPVFLLIIFGYALTLDVDNVPLIIWDQSDTPESREFISRFTGSPYFSLNPGKTDHYDEIVYAMDSGTAVMAMVIPYDFAKKIKNDHVAKVQVIVDGSDANTATIALGYAEAIARDYSIKIQQAEIRKKGELVPDNPTDILTRVWYNEEKESKHNIIPGLIGVIMMVISAILTSLTISREWERGTMEQLISTPVTKGEMIAGKMLPYFVIGMLDVLLIVGVGQLIFDIPMEGSFFLLMFMAAIFLVGALGLGFVISVIAKNQLVSTQMAMVITFLPSVLLSGFMNSIHNMPTAVQYITYLVPARYFIYMLKAIYLKGIGLQELLWDVLFLIVFAIFMLILSNVLFRKKLV